VKGRNVCNALQNGILLNLQKIVRPDQLTNGLNLWDHVPLSFLIKPKVSMVAM